MALKTFCLQNLNFIATLNPKFFIMKTICEFDFVCKIYEFPKKFKMKIQNENEWKINFLSNLKGQIVRYMFVGGLFINYPTHIVINPYSPISHMWMDGWNFLFIQNLDEILQMDKKNDGSLDWCWTCALGLENF